MAKPSLNEVLKKHKAHDKQSKKPHHVVLHSRDAKALFFDLPKHHKFWAKDGREINNLTELYRSLVEMSNEVFKHHVNRERDDFAKWAKNSLHDSVLARRLKSSRTKLEHVEIVKRRIEQLKGFGRRIPRPQSNLAPDFSFIEVEQKIPRPVKKENLEHHFRIRPHRLTADVSFIDSPHSRKREESKLGSIMESQREVENAVRMDIQEKQVLTTEVEDLKDSYEMLSGQLSAIRNELGGIKSELKTQRETSKRQDASRTAQMKNSISQLRNKENDMMGELKVIARTEDKIMSKNDALMEKERELGEKESQLLRKEGHYQTLMDKYEKMFTKIQQKMSADEKRIQSLFEDTHPKSPEKHSEHHSKHHHEHHHKHEKDDQSVKEMLDMTMSGKGDLLHIMEIDKLLDRTKGLIEQKDFTKARHYIDKIKKIVASADLDKDYKKSVYYQVFELSTELDLESK